MCHTDTVAKDYYESKRSSEQPISSNALDALGMPLKPRKPINEVLAESLRYWMKRMGYEGQQTRLAKASGVSQRTISNYLHPQRRLEGSTGKLPSAKLVEVEQVAVALNVAVWELLRAGSAAERDAYHEAEELIRRIGVRRSDKPTSDRAHSLSDSPSPSRRANLLPMVGHKPIAKVKRR